MERFICSLLLATSLYSSIGADPVAISDLVIVNAGESAVVRLKGFDLTVRNLIYSISTLPVTGSLNQLSQVFSTYGYDPKNGVQILTGDTSVTGTNNRIVYNRPTFDTVSYNKWDSFQFTVNNGASLSMAGMITLVPPTGAIVGEDFLFNNGGWLITGNKAINETAIFEPFSRGLILNHYIYGTDDKINVDMTGAVDQSLWYFQAPTAFLGNLGIAYKGYLKFSLGAFSGNFSQINQDPSNLSGGGAYLNPLNIVELECEECQGPVTKGIRLGFPVTAISTGPFDGTPSTYVLTLSEEQGWSKDPQNVLLPWTTPTKCDMIQVLSRLSSLKILGDWTPWFESVAMDNVQIINNKAQLPRCALTRLDASVCTC
mmetsp:Transcript_30176/g.28834  ORF Transcript_30176/g.28834 Transcript_30176/m.28834 type:complete len:372 (-) Transcript_30176:214-1329(-)|eukprot:CAMPEP_0119035854 /NCGR_PEP_ID=MMETSP1177-20130426/3115_1 /TAXON_ID=2985 /ORGANISM="Ochromonas sp, Strain CCMP1899" /LENGTH=371 /DNA_ID=CAMNT_0006994707 /DNA_START=48 /DNA_END=1163 /DNA_ORIENTATION=-